MARAFFLRTLSALGFQDSVLFLVSFFVFSFHIFLVSFTGCSSAPQDLNIRLHQGSVRSPLLCAVTYQSGGFQCRQLPRSCLQPSSPPNQTRASHCLLSVGCSTGDVSQGLKLSTPQPPCIFLHLPKWHLHALPCSGYRALVCFLFSQSNSSCW